MLSLSRITGIAAAALLALPLTATAQDAKSNTTGFSLGLAAAGAAIEFDEVDDESLSGGGATIRLGWGFNRMFTLFLEGTATSLDADDGEWTLGHGDLGGRFHFGGPSSALRPFLEAAFSFRSATNEDILFTDDGQTAQRGELEISGGGFSIGGGLLFYFNPKLALHTDAKFTSGEFDTVRFRNVSVSGFEVDATSTRFNIGLTWFPMRAR
jgi:hypothetical protein